MNRELRLDEDQGRWTCSLREWELPAAHAEQGNLYAVERAFEAHACSQHPNKKRREDANQAAFRIVKEATERD